jgi:hypothetical protein
MENVGKHDQLPVQPGLERGTAQANSYSTPSRNPVVCQENGEGDNGSTIREYILYQSNHLAYVGPLATSNPKNFNI